MGRCYKSTLASGIFGWACTWTDCSCKEYVLLTRLRSVPRHHSHKRFLRSLGLGSFQLQASSSQDSPRPEV